MVAANGQRGPVRIVVIEDDADLGELLVGELGNRGYDAIGVGSAAEALRALVAADADLLIADIQRPELRGPELLHAALDRRPDLLVVLIGYIRRVLAQTGNNAARAAQILGIDRRMLYRKLAGAP